MNLLLDAGNSRLKWAIVDGTRWLAEGACEHDRLDGLEAALRQHVPLRAGLGVNVAGEIVRDRLQALGARHGLALQWLQSSAERCGVRNLYDDPAQLGTDRWAALIGARAMHGEACIVVCAGTATTVDLLDAEGCFQGGLILPGEQLMRQSLARDTARLPLAEGEPQVPPRSTVEAIVTGCLFAQAGAIERMFARIADLPGASCLLAGGNAARIAPLLSIPSRRIDNLVLRGLAVICAAEAR